MIHLACREHLPCALAEVDRLRAVNQQQADGWQDTHRELTRAKDALRVLNAVIVAYSDEIVELRRRLGEVGP